MAKGIGGMGNLLKQVQEMQSRMAKIQEELAQKTVDGSAGGGMVRVTVNGQLALTAIKIDPSVINSEEKEMLEEPELSNLGIVLTIGLASQPTTARLKP